MIITSIIISVSALAMSLWLGRRNPVRSSGVTAGMLVLLMLAPLVLILPKVEVSAEFLPWAASASGGSVASPAAERGWGLVEWGLALWLTGCAVMLSRLLFQSVLIKRWCVESVRSECARDREFSLACAGLLHLQKMPDIRYSRRLNSPVITGLLRPVLLLPESAKCWGDETLRMVMMHELGHLKRRDLWTSMAANIACALHWFNPLVWMLRQRLKNECEYACDAHVISHGANPKSYILALCDVAESCGNQAVTPMGALAMANSASLKQRVANVLERPRRSNPWMVIGVLVVSASATLAFNIIRPELQTPQIEAVGAEPKSVYTPAEVKTRLEANPFPEG